MICHIGHKITSEHTLPRASQAETGAGKWTNRLSASVDEFTCIFPAVGYWSILQQNRNSTAPATRTLWVLLSG